MKQPYSLAYSLIELLIASMFALFLSACLMMLYLNNNRNYYYLQALQLMAEQMSQVNYFLRNDISEAGFIGCASNVANKDLLQNYPNKTFISAYENYQGGDSDALVVTKASNVTATVLAIKSENEIITTAAELAPGDKIIMSDCEYAETATIEKLIKQKNNLIIYLNKPLNISFSPNLKLYLMHAILYFVADTGRKNKNGSSIFALYRKNVLNGGKTPAEIVENVRRLRFYYDLLDTKTGEVKRNLTTPQIVESGDWQNIIAVKAVILVTNANATIPMNFINKDLPNTNKSIDQEMEVYIAVRNNLSKT